jgi:hypothetical protein
MAGVLSSSKPQVDLVKAGDPPYPRVDEATRLSLPLTTKVSPYATPRSGHNLFLLTLLLPDSAHAVGIALHLPLSLATHRPQHQRPSLPYSVTIQVDQQRGR